MNYQASINIIRHLSSISIAKDNVDDKDGKRDMSDHGPFRN